MEIWDEVQQGENKDHLEIEAFFVCGETERIRVVKPGENKAQKECKREQILMGRN